MAKRKGFSINTYIFILYKFESLSILIFPECIETNFDFYAACLFKNMKIFEKWGLLSGPLLCWLTLKPISIGTQNGRSDRWMWMGRWEDRQIGRGVLGSMACNYAFIKIMTRHASSSCVFSSK